MQDYKTIYTATDVKHHPPLAGEYPYTRGVYPNMYRHRPWTIRQYAGFSSVAESNAFYRQALQAGQTGLSIAFDLPTHRGYDSSHPRVQGDVGKAGVAIDSVDDMQELLAGIPLAKTSVSMTMNGAVLPILASFLVVAEEQGVAKQQVSGTIQNDILKEYIVRNTYIYPPDESMRISTDIITYLSEHYPRFNSISVSGYHLQEAGAEPALELAFTIANALTYLDAACARGLSVDAVAPRISFFFCIGMDFLQEIAKLRAARSLWAELVRAKYQPQNPRSCMLRTHCQTSGYSLTQQSPLNNVVRTTIEAMAAVLGGTQSLHTNAYDEAVSLPTDTAAKVARDTQLILQHETDLLRTVDPLAGSYAIEHLTASLQQQAKKIINNIAAQGGMLAAIKSGYAKEQIKISAARRQALVDSGKQGVIGVNKFTSPDELLAVREIDSNDLLQQQQHKLTQLKQKRNNHDVQQALANLTQQAKTTTINLMPATLDAVRARATVGEISAALATVFTRYQPQAQVELTDTYVSNYGEDDTVARVRTRVERFKSRTGRRPRILVAKFGQDGHDRGMHVVAVGFSNLGFDVDLSPLFQTPEEVARCAIENDVHVLGISSHAAAHNILLPKLVAALQAEGATKIRIVLGGIVPPQDYDYLHQQGVNAIFATGTPIPACAEKVLDILEH
ncbi:MAG: methylmalonyl-CoA mutase [Pseudomonadota bacterium]|nr:methylmalonyl-CoA mutase [Pseudomonadota bacterium]